MKHERKRRPARGGADQLGGDRRQNSENTEQAQGYTYSQEYRLDSRFCIEFVLNAQANRLDCYWFPHMPKGRKAKALFPAYRRARDQFIGSLGIPALVVEL